MNRCFMIVHCQFEEFSRESKANRDERTQGSMSGTVQSEGRWSMQDSAWRNIAPNKRRIAYVAQHGIRPLLAAATALTTRQQRCIIPVPGNNAKWNPTAFLGVYSPTQDLGCHSSASMNLLRKQETRIRCAHCGVETEWVWEIEYRSGNYSRIVRLCSRCEQVLPEPDPRDRQLNPRSVSA